MKKSLTIAAALLLCLSLLIGCSGATGPFATAEYITELLEAPSTGSPGGEWTVLGLARCDALPEGWKTGYESALAKALEADSSLDGKATDYIRALLALRALDSNLNLPPFDVLAGILEDTEKTALQGPAAIASAIIALDGLGPEALKEEYYALLREYQLPTGGFAAKGVSEADADITALCLQALAHCANLPDAENLTKQALSALSLLQQPDGGFLNGGAATCESLCQVIIALTELGIDLRDERFVKSRDLLEVLGDFALSDGSYSHTSGGSSNLIATEQALLALTAVYRWEQGLSPLYSFESDAPCSLIVSCAALLDDKSALEKDLVPPEGIILQTSDKVSPGETAFDLLQRLLRREAIPMETSSTPLGGIYIEGISNIYEFDFGDLSGWTYRVNGEFVNIPCSMYELQPGDAVVFEYVIDYVDESKREAAAP